jgi:hypothetical protein
MNKVILNQNLNAGWKNYGRRDTTAEFKSPRWRVNNMLWLTQSKAFCIVYLNIGGWSPYWVHSALWPLLAYCSCPRWLWGWRSWLNEWFWQGKPKYSEKTCPDATLSTTNPTCQTRTRTRATAVGSQWLTTSAMERPKLPVVTKDASNHQSSMHLISPQSIYRRLYLLMQKVWNQTVPLLKCY